MKNLLPAHLQDNSAVITSLRGQLKGLNSPWFRYYLKYDPSVDLKKVECPVLALNGEMDLQVKADDNLNAIKTLVKGSVTTIKYPQMNHLFQTVESGVGLPQEYGYIKETMSEKVLEDISKWILQTTK